MADYESEVNRLPHLLSLGVATIRIARADQLEHLQIGFARDGNGRPLTGESEGDWRSNWLVIGQDDTCGDPIFIDTNQSGFPVYTAMIGQGEWRPAKIASSLKGFGHALLVLLKTARGREDPLSLKANPITDAERARTLLDIQSQNRDADLEFWAVLIDAE